MRYWTKDDKAGINADWLPRIAMILDRLDSATAPTDMDLPGLHLHALKGDAKGRYSVRVTGNWRVTFGWQGDDALDVDLEDYH